MSAITLTAAKIAAQIETQTRSYIAGEAITVGQAVCFDTDGTVLVAAATGGIEQFVGIALNGATAGEAVQVAHTGVVDGFAPAGNAGSLVYLSDTAGGLDTSAGSMTVVVGKVIARPDATKTIYFDTNWLAVWS